MATANNIILLVDDENYTLDSLAYGLSKSGFKIATSTNGMEAIRTAREIIPSVILLDIMMPGMDGISTCIELRKISSLHRTVIALLGCRGEDQEQIAGFAAGADDYIHKPIRLNVLIHRLKALQKRVLRNSLPC